MVEPDEIMYAKAYEPIWMKIAGPPARFPTAPAGDLGRFNVCVVGGGIFGLTTAHLLQQAQLNVAVLEMGAIGASTTGSSTAKLSSRSCSATTSRSSM